MQIATQVQLDIQFFFPFQFAFLDSSFSG